MWNVIHRQALLRRVKSIVLVGIFFVSLCMATTDKIQDDLQAKVTQTVGLPFPKEAARMRAQLRALGTLAIPFIVKIVRSDSEMLPIKRNLLIGVIADDNSEQADAALLELISDDDPYVRGSAVSYIGKRKQKKAVLHLIGLLNDRGIYQQLSITHPSGYERQDMPYAVQDVLVRDVAIEALQATTGIVLAQRATKDEQAKAWLRWSQVRERVLQAINLPFPDKATTTKTLLSDLGPKGAPFIAEVVKSRDDLHPIRKTFLIDILAGMCGLEVENAMFGLLSDEDPYVRGLTTTYLAKRKLESAIPYLINLLDDKEVYKTINQTHPTTSRDILIRDVAIDALATITGRVLAPQRSKEQQAKAWLRWWQKQQRTK